MFPSTASNPLPLNPRAGARAQVRDSDTVEVLRRRVARERRFELAELTVVFAGRRLDDGLTLSDYNVRHDSCVHVQARKGVQGGERGSWGVYMPRRLCPRAGGRTRADPTSSGTVASVPPTSAAARPPRPHACLREREVT